MTKRKKCPVMCSITTRDGHRQVYKHDAKCEHTDENIEPAEEAGPKTPPQDTDRDMWLLRTPPIGQPKVDAKQYEELRALANKLAHRASDYALEGLVKRTQEGRCTMHGHDETHCVGCCIERQNAEYARRTDNPRYMKADEYRDLPCPECGKMLTDHVIVSRHKAGTSGGCDESFTGPSMPAPRVDYVPPDLLARVRTSLYEAHGALANRRQMKSTDLDLIERDLKDLDVAIARAPASDSVTTPKEK